MQGIIVLLVWSLVALILFPALKTFQVSLTENDTFALTHYLHFLSAKSSWMTLLNSIVLGLLTVVVSGLVGTLLAFLVHFWEMPGRVLLDKILLIPMMLPGLIIVFAFIQLYGESGIVTQFIKLLLGLEEVPWHFAGLSGILIVHAFTQYVYFYLNVSIAIRQIDNSVLEAARNMGASKGTILKTILIPFLMPAFIASSIVTFMSGIGSFSAPSLIGGGYRVMTVQILMSKANNYMAVAAMQVVLLSVTSMLFLWLMKTYERRMDYTSSVRAARFYPVAVKRSWYKALQYGALGCLCLLILAPVLMIVVGSFVKPGAWMVEIFPSEFSWENYLQIFTKTRTFAPFKNSILMALAAGVLTLFIGIPASALIVKSKSRSKPLIEFLVMLPWTMPASAIAINTINAYNKPSVFSFNQILVGSFLLLPIAYFVSSIPLMVRTLNVAFHHLSDTHMEASKSLGAGGLRTFQKVVVPIIMPGIAAGFLLVFIRSIGEYTMSVFLYTVSNKPISIAMVNAIFEYDIGLAMAYGALLVFLSGGLSYLINKLLPQKEMR